MGFISRLFFSPSLLSSSSRATDHTCLLLLLLCFSLGFCRDVLLCYIRDFLGLAAFERGSDMDWLRVASGSRTGRREWQWRRSVGRARPLPSLIPRQRSGDEDYGRSGDLLLSFSLAPSLSSPHVPSAARPAVYLPTWVFFWVSWAWMDPSEPEIRYL